MCLGVPGRCSRSHGLVGHVDFWGVRRPMRLDVVDEPVAPGDYILNHVGLRHPPHPARGDRRDAGALRAAAARPAEDDLMAADVRGEIAAAGPRAAAMPEPATERPASSSSATRRGRGRSPRRCARLTARDRPRAGLGDARLRQPRAGHRQVRPARRLPARPRTSSWARAARSASPTCPRWTRRWRWRAQGVRIATYGDMLRVPGHVQSLADAQADGAQVDVVYSVAQAVELAREHRRGGGLLRHRLRDHRGRDRRGRARRSAAELLGALGAQVHPAGDGDRGRDAGARASRASSPPGTPRPSPAGAIFEPLRRAPPAPGGGRRLRAARHPGRPGASWSS